MQQRHLIQRQRVTPLSNIRDHEATQRRPGYIPPHHAAKIPKIPAQSAAVSVGILLYGPTKLGPRRLGRPNVRASKTLTVVYKNTVLPRLTFWDKVTYCDFRLNVPQRTREWYMFWIVLIQYHRCAWISETLSTFSSPTVSLNRTVRGSVSVGQSCGEVPLVASATVVVSSIVRLSQRNQREEQRTQLRQRTPRQRTPQAWTQRQRNSETTKKQTSGPDF